MNDISSLQLCQSQEIFKIGTELFLTKWQYVIILEMNGW